MSSFRQMSFAGGELAPTLWGRSDLAKYAVGLKKCRNFFITKHGAASTRAGTTYVGATKTTATCRLIPFVYSDAPDLSWVLEFGNLYIRFWWVMGDQTTLNPNPDGSGILEITTPYTTADLPFLKYAQQGAVMTICHPSYPAAELKLTSTGMPGNPTWSYGAISFDRPAAGGANFYLQEPLPQLIGVAWNGSSSYNLAAVVSFSGLLYESIAGSNAGHAPYDTDWWTPYTLPVTPREWTWAVSEVWQDSRGILFEKKYRLITKQAVQFYALWNGNIVYVGGGHNAGTQVTSNGLDGGTAGDVYRCIVTGTQGAFLSDGSRWTLDNTVQSPAPLQEDNLPGTILCAPGYPVTIILNGAYANALTDPNFIGLRIYRGRGGVFGWVGDAKWNTATFTDSGEDPDYSIAPPLGTNPFNFYNASGALISTEYPACVTFFEGRRVFGNTVDRPGFIFGSATDDYANFDQKLVPTTDMAVQFELASRRLEDIRFLVGWQKLICGTQSSVWAVAGGNGPLAYNNVDAKVQTSVGASWLDPLVIQGTLLYCRTKGVGVHALGQDVVQQSWTDEDVSILAEHLFTNLTVTDWTYAQDPLQIVWAVRSDGVLLSFTYVKSHDVWAWAWHDTDGAFESVATVPVGTEDRTYVLARRVVGGATVRHLEYISSRAAGLALDANKTVNFSSTPTTVVTGLSHLNGATVMAVADGMVQGPFTVSGGSITLNQPASNAATVGRIYLPQLQTLDLAANGGEVKIKQKTITRVGLELDNSKGVSIGADFDHLTELQQRQVVYAFGSIPATSAFYPIAIAGTWTQGGGVCLQQNSPLPLTVLSVLREVEFGDR